MGGAQSKNVANAVASVTNSVITDTVGDIDNISQNQISTVISNSQIILSGDLNIQNTAKNVYISHQVATQLQHSQIKNDISQKMMQEAISKVGALGVGYASAENCASMFASASNYVKDSLTATVGNFSSFTTQTIIDNSYIKANNLNITNLSSSNYVTDQTIENSQISDIDNKISQDISQKASATIQGLTGLLLALALLIGVCAYALSKPLNTNAVKTIISAVLVIGIIILLVWLMAIQAPPLFTKAVIVSPHVSPSQNGNCTADIINVKIQEISLNNPPLKYLYAIYTDDKNGTLGCLLTLACTQSVSNPNSPNRGFNYITYNTIENGIDNDLENIRDQMRVPSLPIIFVKNNSEDDTDTVYYVKEDSDVVDDFSQAIKEDKDHTAPSESNKIVLPNFAEFTKYCQNVQNAKYARFALCKYLGIPNYYYIYDNEPIMDLNNNIGIAQDIDPKSKMQITTFTYFDYPSRMLGSCKIKGEFGICNSGTYKVAHQFKMWGIYIFIIIIIGVILMIFLKNLKKKS